MILCFRTHGSGQTVQTQIRLLLEEQSDQGLHCLLFHLHLFLIPKGLASFFEFRFFTAKFSRVRKFRNFPVMVYRYTGINFLSKMLSSGDWNNCDNFIS